MFGKNSFLFSISFIAVTFSSIAKEPTIIEITQSPCKFDQLEKDTSKYSTSSAKDCEVINQTSIKQRKELFNTLKLSPGTYVFRVTNYNIPYEVGFYLRGAGLSWLSLPRVSGGEIYDGITRDYKVNLEKGKYNISCPLNPTPDYELIVE